MAPSRWSRPSGSGSVREKPFAISPIPLPLLVGVQPEFHQRVYVGAVPVLRSFCQILPHARLGALGQGQVEVRVGAPHGGNRVSDQLAVSNVENTLGGQAGTVPRL